MVVLGLKQCFYERMTIEHSLYFFVCIGVHKWLMWKTKKLGEDEDSTFLYRMSDDGVGR